MMPSAVQTVSNAQAEALNAEGDRIGAVALVGHSTRVTYTATSGSSRGMELAAPSTSVERAA